MGPHTIDVQKCFQRTSISRNDQLDFLARLQKVKKRALYVNNSWRKVKFKLRNKLINVAAASAVAGGSHDALASAYARVC